MFAAQGRRHLSQYRNAEIKGLLADLLGLERIGQLGVRALEVVRGLKAGLATLRVRQSELVVDSERLRGELAALSGAGQRVALTLQQCAAARDEGDAARLDHARVLAEQSQSAATDAQRARLEDRQRLAAAALLRAEADGARQQDDCRQRSERLDRRVAQRIAAQQQQRATLQARLRRVEQLLADAPRVGRAEMRLPLARKVAAARAERLEQARQQVEQAARAQEALALARQRLAGIEQTAGQAVLRERELTYRFALTGAVPCNGLPLQDDANCWGMHARPPL